MKRAATLPVWHVTAIVLLLVIGTGVVTSKLLSLGSTNASSVVSSPTPAPIAQETENSSSSAQLSPSSKLNPNSATTVVTTYQRTKNSNCLSHGAYPDNECTPGAVFPVTKQQVCVSGYSSSVRNVPESEKNAVYAEYGIATHTTGQYEVDHLISLELGGSNDIANLWPEPASPTPGFHEKDKVENYLHAQVCNGSMTLSEAQNEIAHDWLSVYQHMGGSTTGITTSTTAHSSTTGTSSTGATAKCVDGTYSFATHHQGACSKHGGVAVFYN